MLDLFRAGTAVVQTRLIFNSSAPIPSETLVLNAITALLSSQLTNISDSIKVLNFTYESTFCLLILYDHIIQLFTSLSHPYEMYMFLRHSKRNLLYSPEISNSSYAVIFTFHLSNISMPEKPDVSNNIHNQVWSSINNAVSVNIIVKINRPYSSDQDCFNTTYCKTT